jgi:transposase
MQESDSGLRYGSEDPRTLDPTLQQHLASAQQVLKDRQMRDWEKRLRAIEEYRKNSKRAEGSKANP